jgi:hypothetical protein
MADFEVHIDLNNNTRPIGVASVPSDDLLNARAVPFVHSRKATTCLVSATRLALELYAFVG